MATRGFSSKAFTANGPRFEPQNSKREEEEPEDVQFGGDGDRNALVHNDHLQMQSNF